MVELVPVYIIATLKRPLFKVSDRWSLAATGDSMPDRKLLASSRKKCWERGCFAELHAHRLKSSETDLSDSATSCASA